MHWPRNMLIRVFTYIFWKGEVKNRTTQVRSMFWNNLKITDSYLKVRLRREMGSYHDYDAPVLIKHVETAIVRARELDNNPGDRWPQTLGTRVYLLAESVINNYAQS